MLSSRVILSLLLLGTLFVVHSSAIVNFCWRGTADPARGKMPDRGVSCRFGAQPKQYCYIKYAEGNATGFSCTFKLLNDETEWGECKGDFSVIPCKCQKDNCNLFIKRGPWNETDEGKVVTTPSPTRKKVQ